MCQSQLLACGPDAALSDRPAAALHGLRATARSRIEVLVPYEQRLTWHHVHDERSRVKALLSRLLSATPPRLLPPPPAAPG